MVKTLAQWFALPSLERHQYAIQTFENYRSSPVWYEDFERYLRAPEFGHLLDAFMREVRRFRVTHEHFGAKAIWEIIRYETHAHDRDPLFKLNNNFCSSVANLVVCMFPELEEFFERRRRVA